MSALNLTQKLFRSHRLSGDLAPGSEFGLKIDQTLTQDATGTLVMLELEALDLDYARPEYAVQYVDHNLLQEDYRNPDDHRFLQSAAQRFGLWFSRPGNGVSHPLHQERFGKPGETLLGSDSHTCAAGAIGMLAIGSGGLEVAMAIAGEPFYLKMPRVWNVRLVGELPDWVSAKDIILEMLRRHDVKGAVGWVLEYSGPALEQLSAMDRHVIANMGAELGATASVFPSDEQTRRFLGAQQREKDWRPLAADEGADYDCSETVDLNELEPLIALPSSPGNVVPVREVAGEPIYQAYIGSSANPGYRDFAMAAEIVRERMVAPGVSFDVNPTSRQILENLAENGHLKMLLHSGARLHQAGCNGCIGMGQAPATDQISLRTVPRNFPGRSGTREDRVYLVSPETAAASALTGRITDPRELNMDYPRVGDLEKPTINRELFLPPPRPQIARETPLVKGPNVGSLPKLDPLPEQLEVPILLRVGDNVSTDEIMPAGARVLPYRSNIEKISEFVYTDVDPDYVGRAGKHDGGHAIVGGSNYGQGSSREHAAIAPRYLGLRVVVAESFARIHWQNLINFGVLPLTSPDGIDAFQRDQTINISQPAEQLRSGSSIQIQLDGEEVQVRHELSPRQVEVLIAGGLVPWLKQQRSGTGKEVEASG